MRRYILANSSRRGRKGVRYKLASALDVRENVTRFHLVAIGKGGKPAIPLGVLLRKKRELLDFGRKKTVKGWNFVAAIRPHREWERTFLSGDTKEGGERRGGPSARTFYSNVREDGNVSDSAAGCLTPEKKKGGGGFAEKPVPCETRREKKGRHSSPLRHQERGKEKEAILRKNEAVIGLDVGGGALPKIPARHKKKREKGDVPIKKEGGGEKSIPPELDREKGGESERTPLGVARELVVLLPQR